MSLFYPAGDLLQNEITRQGLARCDFPFDWMRDSLLKEDKGSIRVEWQDLSQRAIARQHDEDHSHVTDPETGAIAHPIDRVIDGRRVTLGLFYLPPYTKIVLHTGLVDRRELAFEVLLAEIAHAVDYHYMTANHRREITNILHHDNLPPEHSVEDGVAFNLDGHTCSWFDVGPYRMWVGEAFMETFCEAFSDVKVTIELGHPTGPEQARQIRRLLLGLGEEKVFVGAPSSKVYHRVDCYIVPLIGDDIFWNDTPLNRRPCKLCRPHLAKGLRRDSAHHSNDR